jgi:hypothetical protein
MLPCPMDYAGILRILGREGGEIHSVYRAGSRVYGTATEASDEDFVVVLARRDARQDLVFRDSVNIVLHGVDSFQKALADQSVFALECFFLPKEHRLKAPQQPFAYKLDRNKLAESASSRSASDFKKAARTFAEEPLPAKKKLFHALRVPMFALQIARSGKITDYGEATPLWREIQADESEDWDAFAGRVYGPLRERLVAELGRR